MPTAPLGAALPPLPPGGPPVGATRSERLRRACQDFESLFVYKLLEQMRATVPQDGYLHSRQEDIYNSICDQQVAMALARSGGIGLGEMLYRQLEDAAAQAAAAPADEARAAPAGQPATRPGRSR